MGMTTTVSTPQLRLRTGTRPAPASAFPHLQDVSPQGPWPPVCVWAAPDQSLQDWGQVADLRGDPERQVGLESGVGTSYCWAHLGQPIAMPLKGGVGCPNRHSPPGQGGPGQRHTGV